MTHELPTMALGILLSLVGTAATTRVDKQYVAVDLGALGTAADGSSLSVPAAINDHGEVVGYSRVYDAAGNDAGIHAFLFTNGTMQDLGTPDIPVGAGYRLETFALAINERGDVAGNTQIYNASGHFVVQRAFLYTKGRMIDLGALGTPASGLAYSTAHALNRHGDVAGSAYVYDGVGSLVAVHAFVYRNGQMVDLGAFGAAPGRGSSFEFSAATAINDRGQAAGYSTVSGVPPLNVGSYHAFFYEGHHMTDLGPAGGGPTFFPFPISLGVVLNKKGEVAWEAPIVSPAGAYLGEHVLLYDGATTDLGTLGQGGPSISSVIAINDRGDIVGDAQIFSPPSHYDTNRGFLFSDGSLRSLDFPDTPTIPFRGSSARDINDRGEVVGSADVGPSGSRTFLYTNGQMTDLAASIQPPAPRLTAVGINDHGEIIGTGFLDNGSLHAFLLSQKHLGHGAPNAERRVVGLPK